MARTLPFSRDEHREKARSIVLMDSADPARYDNFLAATRRHERTYRLLRLFIHVMIAVVCLSVPAVTMTVFSPLVFGIISVIGLIATGLGTAWLLGRLRFSYEADKHVLESISSDWFHWLQRRRHEIYAWNALVSDFNTRVKAAKLEKDDDKLFGLLPDQEKLLGERPRDLNVFQD